MCRHHVMARMTRADCLNITATRRGQLWLQQPTVTADRKGPALQRIKRPQDMIAWAWWRAAFSTSAPCQRVADVARRCDCRLWRIMSALQRYNFSYNTYDLIAQSMMKSCRSSSAPDSCKHGRLCPVVTVTVAVTLFDQHDQLPRLTWKKEGQLCVKFCTVDRCDTGHWT